MIKRSCLFLPIRIESSISIEVVFVEVRVVSHSGQVASRQVPRKTSPIAVRIVSPSISSPGSTPVVIIPASPSGIIIVHRQMNVLNSVIRIERLKSPVKGFCFFLCHFRFLLFASAHPEKPVIHVVRTDLNHHCEDDNKNYDRQ